MPKVKIGVWQTYNGYLAKRRKDGLTLAEIGQEVNVSRERIRQILKRRYGTTNLGGLLSPSQLGQLIGVSAGTIWKCRRAGIIHPANNNLYYPRYDINAIIALRKYRSCQICGALLPRGRNRNCSDMCYRISTEESHKRFSWRILYEQKGKKLPPSLERKYKVKELNKCQK